MIMATTDGPLGANPKKVETEWIPRDPELYDTANHYHERRDDPDRIVDDTLAEEVIRDGDLHRETGGKWSFRKHIDGCLIRIYCVLGDNLTPMAITGYADVEDPDEAHESDRFDERAVKCEHFRNLINESSPWPQELRWMRISSPTAVEEHSLTTEKSVRYVDCKDCGKRFTSWDDIRKLGCY